MTSARRPGLLALLCGLALLALPAAVQGASPDPYSRASRLDVYTVLTDRAGLEQLMIANGDIVGVKPAPAGQLEVQLVASRRQVARMRLDGLQPSLWLSPSDETGAQVLAPRGGSGLLRRDQAGVYRPYDGPNGIEAELRKLAADHPDIVELRVLGKTVQGRDILALRVGKDIRASAVARPKVLYSALQHAREWIALETNRRLAHHVIEGYGKDPAVTEILDRTELWFIPAANPDGYQLTHSQGFRLWRKNARDLNGDGAVDENNDGVDLNRNFDARWNYDIEGSSGTPASQTYRGPSAASEPETAALQNLLSEQKFSLMLNYHSAAELILYPDGWQDETRVADDPIFTALAGTVDAPAIPGFEPMLSAGLYITNGETCDFAHSKTGALCYTPELSTPPQGSDGSVFEFPDDEALIQAEFEKNLPFALDVARTAQSPTSPSSHLGNTAQPIIAEAFAVSYGARQAIEANVQRVLGEVSLVYRINGGSEQRVATVEWPGGEIYGDTGDVHYHRVRGEVQGARAGDDVTVLFEAGGQASAPFTYRQEVAAPAPILVVAAEDYSGGAPDYAKTDGPSYLQAHLDALAEADLRADVYDVDAHARTAPSPLGVLSHYRAVIWYTGDDLAPLPKGRPAGSTTVQARDMMLAIRDYLNEGGKVIYTGKNVGLPYLQNLEFNPQPEGACVANQGGDGCETLSEDFVQYYLGIWNSQAVDGLKGGRLTVTDGPLAGLSASFGGDAGQDRGRIFSQLTSQVMPPDTYPQFETTAAGRYSEIGPKARTGQYFLHSGSSTYDWQRFTRTVDLRGATAGELTLALRRQLRPDFDAFFVEAHPVGSSSWTTLPDVNGHTSPQAALTCTSEPWYSIFPHLPHYMTRVSDDDCQPVGTTGKWFAASGQGSGWEDWKLDLTPYAGQEVELSLSYIRSRLAFPGAYVDDVKVTVDGATVAETSFEADLGGWVAGGLPVMVAGTEQPHEMDWSRKSAADLPAPEGSPIAVREDIVTLGFGLESIPDLGERSALLRKILLWLDPGIDSGPNPTPEPTETPGPTGGRVYLPLLRSENR